MSFVNKLVGDLRGIAAQCGTGIALRWLGSIAFAAPAILKRRDLLAADSVMGPGPFDVRLGKARAKLMGPGAFSGLREIWVRDVYRMKDLLTIKPGGLVLDLGANMGNFSMLALATQPDCRVVAVEPNAEFPKTMMAQAKLNGFADRIRHCGAFIGVFTKVQTRVSERSDYATAPTLSEDELIREYGISEIDLLKCDIEGSEYFLIDPASRLLDMTRQIALELHGWGGDTGAFIDTLKAKGFEIAAIQWDGNDCILAAVRPDA